MRLDCGFPNVVKVESDKIERKVEIAKVEHEEMESENVEHLQLELAQLQSGIEFRLVMIHRLCRIL